jgi:hypothetical protein
LAKVSLAIIISAAVCNADTPDSAEPASDVDAARRAAEELLVPIGEAYFCKFSRISVTPKPSGDGHAVSLVCKGEKCDEALHVLNYRGQPSRLSFSLVPAPPERSRPRPQTFDLIHEIDPPADLPGDGQ